MPHRDPLAAAQERIRALEDRVEELSADKAAHAAGPILAPIAAPPPSPEAIEPFEGQEARVAKRVARAKQVTADAERNAEAAMADHASTMQAILKEALATKKDVLVTILGGGAVGVLAAGVNIVLFATLDDERRLAAKPALIDNPAVFLPTLAAVAIVSIALPRVLHPAPIFRMWSQDRTTYSPGIRLGRGTWAGIAAFGLVVDALTFLLAR